MIRVTLEDAEEEDNEEGYEDERQELTAEQLAEFEVDLLPVRLMLTKVSMTGNFANELSKIKTPIFQLRGISNAMKNSSTIILPQWMEKLKELGLDSRMMPHDVSTRWNSTYDMLEFAVTYRSALDAMTANRGLNLRKYELDSDEWTAAEKLRDTLKVLFFQLSSIVNGSNCNFRSLSMQHCFSRAIHPASAP
jgi:hypothetical protein